ncbi:MAG: hypothetical protein K2I86_02305, partial [Prevotella sp.]|nr:hypothetical protein [Prevotella sp.]
MDYRRFFYTLMLLPALAVAQDSLSTHINYDLTAETAVGTGDYTAYQLVTNRNHILATRPNTAYMRGAVSIEHAFNPNLVLSATID